MLKRSLTILWCAALILLILLFPKCRAFERIFCHLFLDEHRVAFVTAVLHRDFAFEECGAVAVIARWLQPFTTKVFGFSGAFSYAFWLLVFRVIQSAQNHL